MERGFSDTSLDLQKASSGTTAPSEAGQAKLFQKHGPWLGVWLVGICCCWALLLELRPPGMEEALWEPLGWLGALHSRGHIILEATLTGSADGSGLLQPTRRSAAW